MSRLGIQIPPWAPITLLKIVNQEEYINNPLKCGNCETTLTYRQFNRGNKFCSRACGNALKCKGRVLSNKTKTKIKENNGFRGKTHTDEHKSKLSNLAKSRNFGGVSQSRWIKYKGKTLGSTYELKVVQSLDKHGIKWDTCKRFKYIDPFGKERTYTPDIYLNDYNIYLDPKNNFLIENVNPNLGFTDKEKILLASQQNNIRVIILNKNELCWDAIKKRMLA